MTRNPFINAFSASLYIILVVTVMDFVSKTQGSKPDTILAPITFLSLLTLSAAIMGFVFFYQPLQLLIDNKKKEALNLFVRTLAVFAGITIVALVLVLFGVFK